MGYRFALIDTSGAADTPVARLARLSAQLRDALRANDRYVILDVAPVRDRPARVQSIRGCNGGVQKIRNLILTINVVIEEAKTGKYLKAGSVDLRGEQ